MGRGPVLPAMLGALALLASCAGEESPTIPATGTPPATTTPTSANTATPTATARPGWVLQGASTAGLPQFRVINLDCERGASRCRGV
jgi:hypothetical protein